MQFISVSTMRLMYTFLNYAAGIFSRNQPFVRALDDKKKTLQWAICINMQILGRIYNHYDILAVLLLDTTSFYAEKRGNEDGLFY